MRNNRSFKPIQHQQQTQARLVVGGLLILLILGGGLVWLLYGSAAAWTAVLCLLAAMGIGGLLWFILTLLERWVEEDEP